MAQIKGKIKLIKHNTGWSFILIDPENLKAQAVEKFVRGSEAIQSIVLDMTIKAGHVEKTLSQLGYMHAAVWPCFYAFAVNQGIKAETEDDKVMIRNDVKYAIGFVKDMDLLYSQGGKKIKASIPRSFADASKEETSEAIEAIIRLGAEFGMIIEDAATYLERHNKSEFES